MTAHLAPYLHLQGNRTAEAFTLYGTVFGCQPQLLRAADMPNMPMEGVDPQAVMHASLNSPDGINLYGTDMVVDARAKDSTELCIMTDNPDQGRRWFEALAEGGTIDMPFETQEWGHTYGQVTDRFGQSWAVNATPRR